MITIEINGETKQYPAPLNVAGLLAAEEMSGMTIAVAKNGIFVGRDSYDSTDLKSGDTIEIVAPMQGG